MGVDTIDSDVRTVFNWAAVMLLTGADEVKLWPATDSHVIVQVNVDNYKALRKMWVDQVKGEEDEK